MLNESKQIFNITKENTLNLIKKLNKEITCETKEHNSGIYMIYIDDFSDDKIIPIYVGKAVDIQRRYEEHYKEILSLNRLKYNVYSIYNDIGLYDGAFKSCKIFKYMVERNLSLKNYHLIVLELCDKENLEEKEQYYIELLKSEYFGFNQLNAKTLWIPYSIACIKTKDSNFALKYIKCVQENCKNIEKFIDYGFTEFNYNYAFHHTQFGCILKDKILLKELKITNQMILELVKKINSKYVKQKILVGDQLKGGLEELRQTEQDKELIQKYKQVNYIKKQMNGILKELRQKFLSIKIPYEDFPLKDSIVNKTLNNEVYFIISNNGRNNNTAEIIKVIYNIDGINKEFYIQNSIIKKDLEYVEKFVKFNHFCGSKKEVYKVIPKSCLEDYRGLVYPGHISISSEYKNGINDFTLKNKDIFYDLSEIIEDVIKNIKENTKIGVKSSESKKILNEILENNISKNLLLKLKKFTK